MVYLSDIVQNPSHNLLGKMTTLMYALYSALTEQWPLDDWQYLSLDEKAPGHPPCSPTSLPQGSCLSACLILPTLHSHAQWALPPKYLPHLKFNNCFCNYFLMPTFTPDSKVRENKKLLADLLTALSLQLSVIPETARGWHLRRWPRNPREWGSLQCRRTVCFG